MISTQLYQSYALACHFLCQRDFACNILKYPAGCVRTAWYCPTMRELLVLQISVFTQTFTNILRKCTTAHAKTTPWQETSRYNHATLRNSYAIIWRGPSRKIFKKFKNWHAQNSTPAWTYAEARGPTPVTYRQECYANATQMKPPTAKQLSVAWRS